ncbi:MAG: GAF domain-containing protein [Hydrogenophilales bacterium]|nr:GAF domain-containing protein [Hydrogenophilales bacterium]
MKPTLEAMRSCLDGAIPAVVATCARDGTPNVAYASQVHYVDAEHVALSYQFFSKTRENVLAHPYAQVQVIEPGSFRHFRLKLHYMRTETGGPLFEYMKAQLAGIAAQTRMDKVFMLRGADIYRVLDIESVDSHLPPAPLPSDALLSLRRTLELLGDATDLSDLADRALAALTPGFGIRHALLLMQDETGDTLYTLGSLGYPDSGIGAEVKIGEGLIGVAARERIPIRINYRTGDYTYQAAMRATNATEPRIPLPLLANPHSRIAVPLIHGGRSVGVLYAESEQDAFFSHADEDALVVYAHHLAALVAQAACESDDTEPAHIEPAARPSGAPLAVRYFAADHSVFIDNDYLIKGVAGSILWTLLNEHASNGRRDFCNRELRRDPRLPLPDFGDNLETRLILLQRRLAERCPTIALEKTGRGRFRLNVGRPLQLSA